MKRLGLIVNPVAGMGGAVGLKGTDGPELLERARQLGAVPRAEARTRAALAQLAPHGKDLEILTCSGSMGESAVVAPGLNPTKVRSAASSVTTPADTKNAARELASAGVDLLLFSGGDGTARDIHDAVGSTLICLGIPAGVKIQSAVYAASPAVAGYIADAWLTGGINRTKRAEVMDIDEEEYRREILSSRLYGYLEIPDGGNRLQNRKAASAPTERTAQQAIAADVVEQMTDDRYYIIGPGTTCMSLMEKLDLEFSLLGVDVIRARRLVGSDMNERQILDAVPEGGAQLILTPVGGQGFLLGRGNQQISPEVIRRVGKKNILVLATPEKIASLTGRPLLVDTGDPACDSYLRGYYRVTTGYREATVYRVSDAT